MNNSIVTAFVALMVSVLMSSAQQQPTTWPNNPYYFYSNINTPLAMGPQIMSADGMAGMNQKVYSGHDDYSIANTLRSHVVMLSTCLRELKTTKSDLDQTHTVVESVKKELKDTKTALAQTHNVVEGVKKELANVMATVENLKKDNPNIATSIGRMPKSCDDLKNIGHKKSGLFSVMGNRTVDNVYCDFTKPINDEGFQKLIGYVDVKTSPIYFHAQRTSQYKNVNTVLPFDLLRLNLGGGMSTSGIFVAPKSGKYFFLYSGISEININARVEMQVKTDTVDWTRVGQAYGGNTHQTFSLQTTLELAKGNQIRLMFLEGAILDNGNHYTNFIGQLLEEDLTQ